METLTGEELIEQLERSDNIRRVEQDIEYREDLSAFVWPVLITIGAIGLMWVSTFFTK